MRCAYWNGSGPGLRRYCGAADRRSVGDLLQEDRHDTDRQASQVRLTADPLTDGQVDQLGVEGAVAVDLDGQVAGVGATDPRPCRKPATAVPDPTAGIGQEVLDPAGGVAITGHHPHAVGFATGDIEHHAPRLAGSA